MHIADDLEPGNAMMSKFFLDHRTRNNTNNLTPRRDGRFSDLTHQANVPTTINNADVALSEGAGNVAGQFRIRRIIPLSGTTIESNLHPFPFARSQ